MALVPGGTRVFYAIGGQGICFDCRDTIGGGLLIRCTGWFAIEASTVARLREVVGRPILREMAQVVIERTILLQHENNVIDRGEILCRLLCKRRGHRLIGIQGKRAGHSSAGTSESRKREA